MPRHMERVRTFVKLSLLRISSSSSSDLVIYAFAAQKCSLDKRSLEVTNASCPCRRRYHPLPTTDQLQLNSSIVLRTSLGCPRPHRIHTSSWRACYQRLAQVKYPFVVRTICSHLHISFMQIFKVDTLVLCELKTRFGPRAISSAHGKSGPIWSTNPPIFRPDHMVNIVCELKILSHLLFNF